MGVKGTNTKFKPAYYVRVYEMAKTGMPEKAIAESLGVLPVTFLKWKKRHPDLVEILEEARKKNSEQETFNDYLYGRLPKRLRAVWDRILRYEEKYKKNPHKMPIERIEALLADNGKQARQQLFLHALMSSNYSLTSACRRVNVSKRTFERWVLEDPEFAGLVEGIDQAKSDFFQDCLIDACKRGETSAIVFANRTYNAKRGYGNKVTVDHTGSVQHNHGVVSIDKLNLPIKERKAVLKALRKAQDPNIPDAEIINVKEEVE